MTYTPATLTTLGAYWTTNGGVNLGSVGNQRHCKGYHLGKDRIFSDCACKPDGTCEPGQRWGDYSVVTVRDKAGLTNAASAIDLGKLNGSLAELWAFSDWLAKRCLAGHPTTNDVREVIYSPDGQRVWGFKDGVPSLIPDYSDDSHLSHTHISFYRDSEARDKRPAFAPYFAPPEVDMARFANANGLGASSRRLVSLPVGADLLWLDGKPYGSGKVTATLTVPSGGVVDGLPGHRLVLVRAAAPYADGIPRDTWLVAIGGTELDAPDPCVDVVAAEHERSFDAAVAAVEAAR